MTFQGSQRIFVEGPKGFKEYIIRHVSGNIAGLKPSHKRLLDRIFTRRVPPQRLITVELARQLCAISKEIGRQVGILINRQGHIEHTFVGEAQRIYLPDIGRARVGTGHLRGLRHVHTVFNEGQLHRDDLADLTKLRLDCVCALEVQGDGDCGAISYAHVLLGDGPTRQTRTLHVERPADLDIDFLDLMTALEAELAQGSDLKRTDSNKERAVVLGVYTNKQEAAWQLAEIGELAATAGVEVADTLVQVRRLPDSHFAVGRGKLEEAVLRCLDCDATLLIVDHNLTPAQARAIASQSDLRVVDRTQLILDIFAQHAQSRDGKLQVELAQLKYNLPRLTDLDAGLSRLTGGIGGRGPGETKLEINRRRARDRISRLEREINNLSKQRELRRKKRQSSQAPVVSIVGYTNAGKSTLLNALTQSRVLVADQLFATLDATSRRLRFPREREAIITDTVGFIRDLPPDLVKAFRATLEELESADLLLHVVDVGDSRRDEKIATVDAMLAELQLATIPRLLVLNKSDTQEAFAARALADKHDAVAVSARSGDGLPALVQHIAHRLWQSDALSDGDAWAAQARDDIFNKSA